MAHLLRQRRFLPYFVTQFFGAFNDNLFKNGMTTLLVFALLHNAQDAEHSALLAGAIFSIPFFLFSANAGQIADRFPKTQCIKTLKIIEVIIACTGLVALVTHSIALLYATLFILATHSTYYGPIKYAILPEYLAEKELIQGNALVESGTFLAILCGTLVGTYLVSLQYGEWWVGLLFVLTAIIGYGAACCIPKKSAAYPTLKIDGNIFKPMVGILKKTTENRRVFLSILGISWFWFIGSTLIVQLPAYVKYVLYGNQSVLSFLLAVFTVFVALGCQLCNFLLKEDIDGRYCAFSLLVIAACMVHLGHVILPHPHSTMTLMQIGTKPYFRTIVCDIAIISMMTGLFVVPLFAIIQHCAKAKERARIIAGNNIINAVFMVLSPLIAMALDHFGFHIPDIFALNGYLNIPVAFLIAYLIPLKTVKVVLQGLFRLLFRTRVMGLAHIQQAKGPVVVLANHTSFLDVPLLAAFLPGAFMFAVNTEMAKKWWVRWPSKLVKTFPLDPTQPMQTKGLIRAIAAGQSCIIFPEGRLTTTGNLMKMYEGSAMIAEHAKAILCPVWIDGLQFCHLTRLKGKIRQRLLPQVRMVVHPLQHLNLPDTLRGRARRRAAGQQLQHLMSTIMHDSQPFHNSLWDAVLHAAKRYGTDKVILEDALRTTYTYQQLLMASHVLARLLQRHTQPQGPLGFMLPNMAKSVMVFLAGLANGRVWAMLNYTAGGQGLLSACQTAQVAHVITSKRFVARGNYQHLIDTLQQANIKVSFLEDWVSDIRLKDKGLAWLHTHNLITQSNAAQDMNCPAVILFTSGSEGHPKGVVLSHKNLQANCIQVRSVLDLNSMDRVFNALPMFHAFGLTISTVLPLTAGLYQFTYPTPLHYRRIPEFIYDIGATIMVGTNTFLSNYQKFAHPYDFQSLRYVFCGAEKLKAATRTAWLDRFGIRILEGYGATEASPTLAINTPLFAKAGSVGQLLPGIAHRLEKVAQLPEGGKLWVKGHNIMLGYLKADQPGVLQPPKNGWYDTGDVVDIDDEGFVTIVGRVKRFAKIAGEMVSLEAVEQAIAQVLPTLVFAVTTLPDAKKGEKLIVCVESGDIDLALLRQHWQAAQWSELMLPKTVIKLPVLPRLATGKINHPALLAMVQSH